MRRSKMPSSLLGKLRVLWHFRYESELCQDCGRKYEVVWWCPDNELYAALTDRVIGPGQPYASGLYCPRCFDRRARAIGLLLVWQPVLWEAADFGHGKPTPELGASWPRTPVQEVMPTT